MTRRCYNCEEIKPLEDFHACRRDPLGRQKLCKACFKIYGSENRDKLAATAREAYRRDPEYRREISRKWVNKVRGISCP